MYAKKFYKKKLLEKNWFTSNINNIISYSGENTESSKYFSEKEQFFYTKFDIIKHINFIKQYSLIYINNALAELVENPNMYITDKYDNIGTLINIDDLYILTSLGG